MNTLSFSPPHSAPKAGISLLGFVTLAKTALALHRQRVALSKLGADALLDLGLTPAEAAKEATRNAWDVPGNWRA